MLCDICKSNEANIVMQTLREGEVVTRTICMECARKSHQEIARAIFNLGMQLREMKRSQEQAPKMPDAICSACHTPLWPVTDDTKLGCPQCYDALRQQIAAYQNRAPQPQDTAQPAQQQASEEERIQLALQEALVCENYERAAQLRDRLRALQEPAAEGRPNE